MVQLPSAFRIMAEHQQDEDILVSADMNMRAVTLPLKLKNRGWGLRKERDVHRLSNSLRLSERLVV